jgi:hypothetical protein
VIIDATWRSISGARVVQRHQWAANSPNYDHGWRPLSATIYPDDDEATSAIVLQAD